MTFTLHPQLDKDGIIIGDFALSRLLMINDAAYPWFVLVPRRLGVKDAYELSAEDHDQMTKESRAVCRALMTAFDGDKMNVAALGNMVPQLHVHHIVRSAGDLAWPGPVWGHQALQEMARAKIEARLSVLHTPLRDECEKAGLAFKFATAD